MSTHTVVPVEDTEVVGRLLDKAQQYSAEGRYAESEAYHTAFARMMLEVPSNNQIEAIRYLRSELCDRLGADWHGYTYYSDSNFIVVAEFAIDRWVTVHSKEIELHSVVINRAGDVVEHVEESMTETGMFFDTTLPPDPEDEHGDPIEIITVVSPPQDVPIEVEEEPKRPFEKGDRVEVLVNGFNHQHGTIKSLTGDSGTYVVLDHPAGTHQGALMFHERELQAEVQIPVEPIMKPDWVRFWPEQEITEPDEHVQAFVTDTAEADRQQLAPWRVDHHTEEILDAMGIGTLAEEMARWEDDGGMTPNEVSELIEEPVSLAELYDAMLGVPNEVNELVERQNDFTTWASVDEAEANLIGDERFSDRTYMFPSGSTLKVPADLNVNPVDYRDYYVTNSAEIDAIEADLTADEKSMDRVYEYTSGITEHYMAESDRLADELEEVDRKFDQALKNDDARYTMIMGNRARSARLRAKHGWILQAIKDLEPRSFGINRRDSWLDAFENVTEYHPKSSERFDDLEVEVRRPFDSLMKVYESSSVARQLEESRQSEKPWQIEKPVESEWLVLDPATLTWSITSERPVKFAKPLSHDKWGAAINEGDRIWFSDREGKNTYATAIRDPLAERFNGFSVMRDDGLDGGGQNGAWIMQDERVELIEHAGSEHHFSEEPWVEFLDHETVVIENGSVKPKDYRDFTFSDYQPVRSITRLR